MHCNSKIFLKIKLFTSLIVFIKKNIIKVHDSLFLLLFINFDDIEFFITIFITKWPPVIIKSNLNIRISIYSLNLGYLQHFKKIDFW